MKDLARYKGKYQVHVALAMHTFEREQLSTLIKQWNMEFGCQVCEVTESITLILGTHQQVQLFLFGKKKRKYVHFHAGHLRGQELNEEMFLNVLSWISSVQTNGQGIVGLVVSKDNYTRRPLVIHKGEVYDESRLMEKLWAHYAATRVRESRQMESIYYFLRDVPKTMNADSESDMKSSFEASTFAR